MYDLFVDKSEMVRSNMGESVFIYVIFWSIFIMVSAVALFAIMNGVSLIYRMYILRHGKNSEEIDGIYVDQEVIKGKFTTVHPIFEFEYNGQKHKKIDKFHDDWMLGKIIGGKMKLYYNPDLDIVTLKKEKERVYWEYIFLLIVGIVLWLMAVIVLVYIVEGFCSNPDKQNFIDGINSLNPFSSYSFMIHDVDRFFDMDWFILGCLFGLFIIPIQYIFIVWQVGKTISYGYYFDGYHTVGPKNPARFKSLFIYNLIIIAECAIFYGVTRIEGVYSSENYPALCGFVLAILSELVLSGIIFTIIIYMPNRKESEDDKVIYSKCIKAVNDLKKRKGFGGLDLPISEMTRYAELEPAENEYKPLIDPFGLTCMNLWFLKALEEENIEDMRYIVKANRTLIADIREMNKAQNGDMSNVPLYFDMFIFYSNYETIENDKASLLKAIMLEKFFKQLDPNDKYKTYSNLQDFKYNYCMALYHYNFSYKKEPETARSFLKKSDEQIKTEKIDNKYSNAELVLFQRLINELSVKIL